jgi:hypothetical protein
MSGKQFLLFDQPKNFHLVFLMGKPIGAMSLREYCIKSIISNPTQMDSVDSHNGRAIYTHLSFSAAWKEKYSIQKEIMTNIAAGLCPYKPVWMKQRQHYKNFLQALHNGEKLTTNLARR